MGFFARSVQNAILNYFFNGGSMPTITSNKLYVGLCTSINVANSTVSGEPTTNGYARVEINVGASTPYFSAATVGTITNNNNAITFPVNTSSNWGALGYWFISTVSTVGNTAFIMAGQVNGANGVTVNVNQAPTFAVNNLSLDATGF
jgi:hypothetical protein